MKEIIFEKREGREIDPEALTLALERYLKGEVEDYQMAAFLMAVFFRGMSWKETSVLTEKMWRSGETFSRKHRNDFWVDKHSTGGVGDKTSLILVPLVTAVCQRLFGKNQVALPMVSGRGLGHTGGTLDKLEAVPGFSSQISMARALLLLSKNGFFMMGQTPELAPLDRKLYALRDATATVESLPLIVSSIMSKKLSENLDGLVLDVKVGKGAFMKTDAQARELARGLMAVGEAQSVKCCAILTSMEEPLGLSAGNALEVDECFRYLVGEARDVGLHEVTLVLASAMVSLASRGRLSMADARGECEKQLSLPETVTQFQLMFRAQGGNWDLFQENRKQDKKQLCRFKWSSPKAGWIKGIDALAIGNLVGVLGGGRNRKEDRIDPGVGIEFRRKVGAKVDSADEIATVWYRNPLEEPLIEKALCQAVTLSESPVAPIPWVKEVL